MRFSLNAVQPEERRNVVVAFVTLFGIMAAHVMTETARDTLFLRELPASQLPFVYIGVAVATFFIAMATLRGSRKWLGATLAIAGGVTFFFWWIIDPSRPWTFYALYIWSGVFGSLATTQFWLLLARLFTVQDGRRLYALIGAGALIGAVAGAGAAALLTRISDARTLLLVAAAVLGVTSLAPTLMRIVDPGDEARKKAFQSSITDCWQTLRTHPFIQRLAALVIIGTVTVTMVDFLFKAGVAERVPKEDLGTFFATFYAFLNVGGLLAQLFLTEWILRRGGVGRAILVFPALVFGFSVVALGGSMLIAPIGLKATDGVLKHSLNRTATEVLYLPIPERLQRHAKALIDVIGMRGAQAVGSVLILALLAVHRPSAIAGALVVVSAVWLFVAWDLRGHYLDVFRARLRGDVDPQPASWPALDAASLEALIAALNSADDDEVLASLDLLAVRDKVHLVPALIVHHPSERVVVRALGLFTDAGRTDFCPLADKLARRINAPSRARAAALRACAAARHDAASLHEAAHDADVRVRATAWVALAAGQHVSQAEAAAALEAVVLDGDHETRLAVAEAIRESPAPGFTSLLLALVELDEPDVKVAAARALAATRSPQAIAPLIDMLPWYTVRDEARRSLVAIGEPALDQLERALSDDALPRRLRLHLPRTISRFRSQRAADVLLARLEDEPSGAVRYKILRGLGRVVADDESIAIDDDRMERVLERALRATWRMVAWHEALVATDTHDGVDVRTAGQALLRELLEDKISHGVERVFRVLGLTHRDEPVDRIHRGILTGSRKARAGALELLDHLVSGDLRDAVMGLVVSDISGEERLDRGAAYLDADDPATGSYASLIEALLRADSASVRAFAAYHAGEIRLLDVREALRSVEVHPGTYSQHVIDRALALYERDHDGDGGTIAPDGRSGPRLDPADDDAPADASSGPVAKDAADA